MRLNPDIRKDKILQAALRIASLAGGYSRLKRLTIATEANCSEALVSQYFGTMGQCRRAVIRAAIKEKNLSVIAQGIAAGDMAALNAPHDLKAQALKTLAR